MIGVSARAKLATVVIVVVWIAAGEAQRGQPPSEAPRTAKAAAPMDLTGNWVSVVAED